MKHVILLFALIISTCLYAQEPEKTVSITVSGSGKTQDEAKQSALRSAIEQAFGAFISSKTEMLNDKVVADQIATISSGNIISFSILNESQLPDNSWGVTLKAVVSVSKLTSFVEAKGVAIEIKGGMFALNIKQQLLNEQGEVKAVSEMVGLLHEPMQISFDYVIKSSDPKSLDAESKNWEIPLVVTATTNKNIEFCANYFIKTLSALSLSSDEATSYQNLNKDIYPIIINYNGESKTFLLRKQGSVKALNTLTSQWSFYTSLYTIQSGIDEPYYDGIGESNVFDFSSYKFKSKTLTINFLKSGQKAATYSWQDKKTLTQIEQMKGYMIKSLGPIFKYKHGGFVIYEKDGHGLVASITDLGEMDWTTAKTACDELILNGYSDWRLPDRDELNRIYKLSRYGLGGFFSNSKLVKGNDTMTHICNYFNPYWSSSTQYQSSSSSDINSAIGQCFYDGKLIDFFNLKDKYFVRAVRTF